MLQLSSASRLLLIILLSFSTYLFAADNSSELPVVQVKYQLLPFEQTFDAVIEAVNKATLSAQTSGRVVEINVDVDDFVPKGSVILRFRNKKQKAELEEAKAGLKESETRYEEARLEFVRIKDVFAKKLVSKSVFDKATANHQASIQRLDQAKARLVKTQEEFDRTIVKAPYAGIVIKRHIEIGETAKVGQALITGFSMDALRALTKIPQSVVGLIDLNDDSENRAHIIYQEIDRQRATNNAPINNVQINNVQINNAPASKLKRVAATHVTLNPYADPQTHTFNVRVDLPKGLQGLYPGMMVKIAFVTGQDSDLLVPSSSVVYRSEVSAVYVVKPDGNISFRQVRVGNMKPGNLIQILSGLEAGENVALDPVLAGVRLKEQRKKKQLEVSNPGQDL